MAEHVVLFAGPMGAGKTTAVRTLSEIDVVSTEATNTDRTQSDKATTTVALDYGEIMLGPSDKVRLYGVPGQRRFSFMWSVLAKRAMGIVTLVNASVPSAIDDLSFQIETFGDLIRRGGLVVGVSHLDLAPANMLEQLRAATASLLPERPTPVLAVDARNTHHMRIALMTLLADIEMRATAQHSLPR